MTHLLFTLSLERKRDLLRVRQLVRHVANLLGFSCADQLCLTATAFELACQAWTPSQRARISCEIVEDSLQVVCTPFFEEHQPQGSEKPSSGRVSKHLPAASSAAAPRNDLRWILKQLVELAPLDLFEEMQKINQDLLQLLLDLARQRDGQGNPAEQKRCVIDAVGFWPRLLPPKAPFVGGAQCCVTIGAMSWSPGFSRNTPSCAG